MTGCICKHLVAERIEFIRDGHSEGWSDSLLAPITHGREKELYASDNYCLADIVNTNTRVGDDACRTATTPVTLTLTQIVLYAHLEGFAVSG